jgi:hypothetical protein
MRNHQDKSPTLGMNHDELLPYDMNTKIASIVHIDFHSHTGASHEAVHA